MGAGSFTVTTTGVPSAALSESGTLPSGVSFADNGNGTASLAGTPAAGSNGTYPITITANNGISPNASQAFTLKVTLAPAITSAAATTFTAGSAGTFTVSSRPAIRPGPCRSPALCRTGVSFVDNGNGTGTLSGTPATGTGGSYPISFGASNGVGSPASQSLHPHRGRGARHHLGKHRHLHRGWRGYLHRDDHRCARRPLSETGPLPSGVSFADNGNGTASLAGTPAAGSNGTYPITITANNGISPNASQALTLKVDVRPGDHVGGGHHVHRRLGRYLHRQLRPGTRRTPCRSPAPCPNGVSFVDNGDGTGTLSGTPATGTGGSYPISFGASNGVGSPRLAVVHPDRGRGARHHLGKHRNFAEPAAQRLHGRHLG